MPEPTGQHTHSMLQERATKKVTGGKWLGNQSYSSECVTAQPPTQNVTRVPPIVEDDVTAGRGAVPNLTTYKRDPVVALAGMLLIAVVGALAVYEPTGAAALAALLAVIGTLPFLRLYVGVAAVTLPFAGAIAISTPLGVVPLCDIAALLAIVSSWLHHSFSRESWRKEGSAGLVRDAHPLVALTGIYFVVALYSATFNGGSLPTAFQRMEILLVWIVFGVLIQKIDAVNLFIRWFVGACLVLSLAWISTPGIGGVLGSQKNPSGGFISAALIMLVLSPISNKWRLPGIVILCGGLLSTGSRGSMMGLGIAILLILLFMGQWKRIFLPLAVAGLGGLLAFVALPDRVTDRILSRDESGVYNIDIRGTFVSDAMNMFYEAPWAGVGIGNYVQSDPLLQSVKTNDPHNVYVLALAEGGYPLFVAFVIMCAVPIYWLLRKQKTHIVALAIALQVSTLVHAYVDVYWVRGTPVLGWLFIGAAVASVSPNVWGTVRSPASISGSSRQSAKQRLEKGHGQSAYGV